MNRRWRLLVPIMAVIALSVPSTAAAAGFRGPSCADLVDVNGDVASAASYDGDGQLVHARIATASASCRFATYTLYVLDESGASTPLAVQSVRGDGVNSHVTFMNVDVSANDDSIVCVYVTSSVGRGRHIFDRGPDAGCNEVTSDEVSPGGSKWG